MLLPRRVVETDVTWCVPDGNDCDELVYADMLPVRCKKIDKCDIARFSKSQNRNVKWRRTYLSHYFSTIDTSDDILRDCFQLLSGIIG